MNITRFQWDNILSLAAVYGMPLDKKRAIVREYLQCQLLGFLYRQKQAQGLHFIGGTSLRILRGLERFSEDLDFDNMTLTSADIKNVLSNVVKGFEQLNLKPVFLFRGIKVSTWRAEFQFGKGLLHHIGITPHQDEKFSIQFSATKPSWPIEREAVLLNRFGVIKQIVTNTLPTLLSQKTLAALGRRVVKGRDFFDIAWLVSRGVRPNLETLHHVHIRSHKDYKLHLLARYGKIRQDLTSLKSQLKPFLIYEDQVSFLDHFDQIIGQMKED